MWRPFPFSVDRIRLLYRVPMALPFFSVMFIQYHISDLLLSLLPSRCCPLASILSISHCSSWPQAATPRHILVTDVDTKSISKEKAPPHWHVVASQALVTPAVLHYHYNGSGTKEGPYVLGFIPNDPRDPMGFSMVKKWSITLLVAVATLAVSLVSSAYTGGINQIIQQFGASEEAVTLRVLLFVLGVSITKSGSSAVCWFVGLIVCNWSSTVGASVWALWPPGPLFWDLWRPYRLQRRGRGFEEHSNATCPSVLCWCIWFVAPDKRRRSHCGHVRGKAERSRYVSLCSRTFHGPNSRTDRGGVSGRSEGLEMGWRSHGHLYRSCLDHWGLDHPGNIHASPSPQTSRRAQQSNRQSLPF